MGQIPVRDYERLTTVGLLVESTAGLRRVFQRRINSETSISAQSFDVLIRLARTPGFELRMSDLAAQTSLTPSGLTRSVDRLQDQGMVSRRVCPEDRRGAFAVLTEEGQQVMARAIPQHMEHIDEVLGELFSPEEEAQLSSLLRRLRDHLFDADNGWGVSSEDVDGCPSGE